MKKLHPLQEKLLKIFEQNGNELPPYRELLKTLDVASTNTIAHHVKQLKKKGLLGIDKISEHTKNDIVPLRLSTILNLEAKQGVYVLLEVEKKKQKNPFYVGQSENIKADVFSLLNAKYNETTKQCVTEKIKNNPEQIEIAFYFVDNPQECIEMYQHLLAYYTEQKAKLCNQ